MAMIKGHSKIGTFKVTKITYVHVLHSASTASTYCIDLLHACTKAIAIALEKYRR